MHIEDQVLEQFHKGILPDEQVLPMLQHIAGCTWCAERLADLEAEAPVLAPAFLKEDIIKKAEEADSGKKKRMGVVSKQMQLFLYSMKTAVAVAGALTLLFAVSRAEDTSGIAKPDRPDRMQEISEQLGDKSSRAAGYINEISNWIIRGGKPL